MRGIVLASIHRTLFDIKESLPSASFRKDVNIDDRGFGKDMVGQFEMQQL